MSQAGIQAIDFYFDFSSPYGYFAAELVDEMAARHGVAVNWHPYLMGVAMKQTGSRPLTERPLIEGYANHDFPRTARLHGIPFSMPEPFPIAGIAPSRAYYWAEAAVPDASHALARALYRAYFADGRNISDAQICVAVAAEAGLDADALAAGLADPAIKDRLKVETATAIERGVFGSPYFVVDDEPFWGHDRLAQVERWIAEGGW